MSKVLTLTMSNRFEEASAAVRQALDFLQDHGLSVKLVFKVRVSLEEILTNIIKYGDDNDQILAISLILEIMEKEVRVRCMDNGCNFNPLEQPPPDLTLQLSDRPVGGVGVHLVRVLAAQVDYHWERGLNVLDLRFRD